MNAEMVNDPNKISEQMIRTIIKGSIMAIPAKYIQNDLKAGIYCVEPRGFHKVAIKLYVCNYGYDGKEEWWFSPWGCSKVYDSLEDLMSRLLPELEKEC